MERLLKAALIGTGQRGTPPLDVDDRVDRLFHSRASDMPESQLLLRAGVAAIRERAGRMPVAVPPLPAAPPDEGRPASEKLEQLLAPVLSPQSIPLLPEYLQVMVNAQVELPPRLLPNLFDVQDPDRRRMIRTALGHRARWLSQFNPDWSWVTDDGSNPECITKLKERFDDGDARDRLVAFREIRRIDADYARELLAVDLHLEKGEQKRKLIEQLQLGLSSRDEAFLESLSTDRAPKIRQLASDLLGRLAESQLTKRMCQRGAQVLRLEGRSSQPTLTIEIPDDLPPDWEADGISAAPAVGLDARNGRLLELISRIPLSFWSLHFDMSPTQIVAMMRETEPASLILSGLIRGLIRFGEGDATSTEWGMALFSAIVPLIGRSGSSEPQLAADLDQLIPRIAGKGLDSAIVQLLSRTTDITSLPFGRWLQQLPVPWSKELSEVYLAVTRRLFQARSDQRAVQWTQTLYTAAIGLSPQLFSSALEPWSLNADRHGYWKTVPVEAILQRFGEVIRARGEFRAEIANIRSRTMA